MNLLEVVQKSRVLSALAPVVGKATLKTKTYTPELLLIGGITTGLLAGYKFAVAYSEHGETFGGIMDEVREEQAHRKAAAEGIEEVDGVQTNPLSDREMMELYGEVAGKGLRLYGPAAVLTIASVGMILKGHGVLKTRNKGLMTAMVLLEKGFRDYRDRVVAEHGGDADERYLYGAEEQVVVERGVDGEGKKTKTKTKRNTIAEKPNTSIYQRTFDESSPEFGPDRDMNKFYLETVQNYFNDILTLRGFVMLNDVLDQMHFPKTDYGQLVGWSLAADGDDFINFGLDAKVNQNPGDNRFQLNFNVNGVVYEYIGS